MEDVYKRQINSCVKNVLQVWRDTAEIKGTQLVFCDLSTPKNDGSFNAYDDIKQKLMAQGVPPEEIAYIHDAKTETQKAELFAKVRKGQMRVLLGSTAKMGAGTNVPLFCYSMKYMSFCAKCPCSRTYVTKKYSYKTMESSCM